MIPPSNKRKQLVWPSTGSMTQRLLLSSIMPGNENSDFSLSSRTKPLWSLPILLI